MILDPSLRLAVAYGLIALMVLAAVALVWWRWHNSERRRYARDRRRRDEYYRQRDQAAEAPATDS